MAEENVKRNIMISTTVLKYLKNTTANVDFWSSARFSCGPGTKTFLTVPKSWWKKILCTFNVVAHLSYAIFMAVRFIQYTYLEGYDVPKHVEVLIEYCFIAHFYPTLSLHSCVYLREETVGTFFNQYISYYSGNNKGFYKI